jgi:chromosomal replication initiator protein
VTEVAPNLHMPRMSEIVRAVCAHYQVSEIDLLSERRARAIARPRQVAMWLGKKMTFRSLPEIARSLRRGDHTTVMHGIKVIDGLIRSDPWIMEDIQAIRRRIGARVLIREALEQSFAEAAA